MLVGIWETNQIVFKQFPANVHMLYYLKTLENQRFFPGVSNEYKINNGQKWIIIDCDSNNFERVVKHFQISGKSGTAWKVSMFGVILDLIFPHLD